LLAIAAVLGLFLGQAAAAEPAPFDLQGPNLRVSVTRRGVTLPIASVPQLAAGDRVKVEASLPPDQTAHYLLVAAFLRDPTNPPPDSWFTSTKSWLRGGRGGPVELIVPAGARHLVLFLAPETRGDFPTLRKAVEGRPGAFVRAAQDLEQASLDRARYDAYLAAIRQLVASAPTTLARTASVVADSLHIKINQDCLQRQSELQAACLLDSSEAVVLANDGAGGNSLSGAATDLALSLSATPAGGLGYYSPYISAIREIIGIFGAMHSARYQYIPALVVAAGDRLGLVLNTPPSFADPKSVLMAALPEIKPAQAPLPQPVPAAGAPCPGVKGALLPFAVNPLFYATSYAHDLKLRVGLPDHAAVDLPLVADAARGGLVIASGTALPTNPAGPLTGTVHGQWGFDRFTGTEVRLAAAGDWRWQPKDDSKSDSPRVLLTGAPASCITGVAMADADGAAHALDWKAVGLEEVAVVVPPPADKRQLITLAVAGPEGIAPAHVTVASPVNALLPPVAVVARSSLPEAGSEAGTLPIVLADTGEIPANTPLSFTLKTNGEERFSGREVVEVGTAGTDMSTRLTFGNGLTLVDRSVLVATLTPAKALGTSAFGPLRARLVHGNLAGEWLDLGTLVRLPQLKRLACQAAAPGHCTLTGDGLYLLASLSATRDFDNAVSVPEGYPGFSLIVPKPPRDGLLFLRLHDAPEAVNRLKAVPGS
jgi:hypothetical protein